MAVWWLQQRTSIKGCPSSGVPPASWRPCPTGKWPAPPQVEAAWYFLSFCSCRFSCRPCQVSRQVDSPPRVQVLLEHERGPMVWAELHAPAGAARGEFSGCPRESSRLVSFSYCAGARPMSLHTEAGSSAIFLETLSTRVLTICELEVTELHLLFLSG